MQWYINVNGKLLRRGYTTGTCAAAALKASLIWSLTGVLPDSVDIRLPIGESIRIPVLWCGKESGICYCAVRKDAGDDADVTDGAVIYAGAERISEKGVSFASAGGVGTVTEEGLPVKVGEPAINPVPRSMMKEVLEDFNIFSAKVYVGVEDGERIAKRTFNERLGIVGGISILGTTGIVEPFSEEAWKESLLVEMEVIKNRGYDFIVLTPGGKGEKLYKKYYGSSRNVLICGNYFGFAVKNAILKGFKEIYIAGSFQKVIKLAAGNFNTDSRVSDAKAEVLALYTTIFEKNYNADLVKEILNATPFSKSIAILEKYGVDVKGVFTLIGQAVIRRLRQLGEASFRVIMFYRDSILTDIQG